MDCSCATMYHCCTHDLLGREPNVRRSPTDQPGILRCLVCLNESLFSNSLRVIPRRLNFALSILFGESWCVLVRAVGEQQQPQRLERHRYLGPQSIPTLFIVLVQNVALTMNIVLMTFGCFGGAFYIFWHCMRMVAIDRYTCKCQSSRADAVKSLLNLRISNEFLVHMLASFHRSMRMGLLVHQNSAYRLAKLQSALDVVYKLCRIATANPRGILEGEATFAPRSIGNGSVAVDHGDVDGRLEPVRVAGTSDINSHLDSSLKRLSWPGNQGTTLFLTRGKDPEPGAEQSNLPSGTDGLFVLGSRRQAGENPVTPRHHAAILRLTDSRQHVASAQIAFLALPLNCSCLQTSTGPRFSV